MPIQQMLLGTSGGANPIDWLGVPSPGQGNDQMCGNYDSKGNFNLFFNNNSWTNVKIKVDGTVDWSKKFASHSAGTFKGCDVGYNDILVCLGYTSNDGIYLWGVSSTGALLWNKKYEINNSSYPNTGNTLSFGQGSGVKAMVTEDVALIWCGFNQTSNSSNQTLFLTVKVTDGTFIGWGKTGSAGDTRGFFGIKGLSAFIASGSTTGYFAAFSEDTTGSGNNQAQYRSWRMKGQFYTASHSGSKDITITTTITGIRVTNDTWDGRIMVADADCLKNSTGSNIDSVSTYVGHKESPGTYNDDGFILNNTFTNNPLRLDAGGDNRMYSPGKVARLNSTTSFITMSKQDSSSDVQSALLLRVSNNVVTWCKRFRCKDSSNNYQQTYTKRVYVDPNGEKGMILLFMNFTPILFAGQFDTGTTAPSNGTYTFATGVGSMEVSDQSVSTSWYNTSYVSAGTSFSAGNDGDKWENTTWSTQSLSDANRDMSVQEWD
jgi:hypothetical protein